MKRRLLLILTWLLVWLASGSALAAHVNVIEVEGVISAATAARLNIEIDINVSIASSRSDGL